MTQFTPSSEPGIVLIQLAIAAARTVALAAVAGLLLRALRVRATSVRLMAWTTVLYAGLSMPVLVWLLPPMPIAVSFLPSHLPAKFIPVDGTSFGPAASAPTHLFTNSGTKRGKTAAISREVNESHPEDVRPFSCAFLLDAISWTTVAAVSYLVVALFLLSRVVIGLAFARRIVRSSKPIQNSRVAVRLASRAHRSGRRQLPCVHESQLVSVPVTMGVFTPAILLPNSWSEWDDAKLDAVLTHEMSHVTRRDSLSQLLALLHRAMLWFSPLAWWLNRHIIELAEQASDEAALSGGAERDQYASTLLGFFGTVQAASGRIRWHGVSMASSGHAEKRLEKVLTWRGDKKMGTKRSVLITILALAVPAAYLVAAASPVSPSQLSQGFQSGQEQAPPAPAGSPTEPPPPADSAPTSLSLPSAPEDGGVSNTQAPPAQPGGPAAPTMPAAPAPPVSAVSSGLGQDQSSRSNHHRGYSYSYGFDDEQRFVIVSGKTDAFTMSGSSEDARHVEKLKKQISGDFIWFQRDEKSYIIRDQATVERARQLWAPQEELGKQQEELGKQQEALGKQQEELGARMEKVRVKIPDMTAELDKLKAELKQLGPDATMEQIGQIESEMGELQSRIGDIQSHAGDEQGKLGDEMGALGEQQGKLGEQQGELGRQQGELAQKATREMKQLLDDAIKKGIAQPESQEPGGASL
jgi:beta-lactamase regulating signal transducer with metallopeptidase domain